MTVSAAAGGANDVEVESLDVASNSSPSILNTSAALSLPTGSCQVNTCRLGPLTPFAHQPHADGFAVLWGSGDHSDVIIDIFESPDKSSASSVFWRKLVTSSAIALAKLARNTNAAVTPTLSTSGIYSIPLHMLILHVNAPKLAKQFADAKRMQLVVGEGEAMPAVAVLQSLYTGSIPNTTSATTLAKMLMLGYMFDASTKSQPLVALANFPQESWSWDAVLQVSEDTAKGKLTSLSILAGNTARQSHAAFCQPSLLFPFSAIITHAASAGH